MKGSLETKLGVFFALAALAAVMLIELSGGMDAFKKGYQLYGDFANVQQLKPGDPVKMAGVPVGSVESFDFVDGKVRVVMKIDEGRVVKTDSIAAIQSAGLIGQNFVALTIGAADAPAFEAEGVMQTKEQADLNAIMTKLDNVAGGIQNLTKSFSGDSIQNVLGPMTDFLKQNNPRITAILADMQVVSSNMLAGRGTMGKFLVDDGFYNESQEALKKLNLAAEDARSLLTEAKGSIGKVEATFDEAKTIFGDLKVTLLGAQKTIDKVNNGEGTLGKLLIDDKLYSESTLAMVNLRQIFEKINMGEGSAGKLVNDEDLYKNAKMTLQKLDKATEGLEDTGPLNILGTAVNQLF